MRVLDFSRVLSGPHCGRALSDLGADVIKVEPPDGDLTRFGSPRRNSMSFYFAQQNAGKRNVSLDLGRPEATELLLRLCGTADVVLENFRPGVMARMGLGYPAVAAIVPNVVYASITGYGQAGPSSDRRAYAPAVQAEFGIARGSLAHWGAGDGGPLPRTELYSHADVYAGLECLAGILAALYMRERTGLGQHVDVDMGSSMLSVNEHVQLELSGATVETERKAVTPSGSPILRSGEGHLVCIAADPAATVSFRQFCRVMERPDLEVDPRFAEPDERYQNRDALLEEVQAWVAGFGDLDELERVLGTERLAMGVVRSVAEVADGEWAAERGAIVEVSDRGDGTIRIPQAPWRFSSADAGVAGPPAYRGEHNREVFAGLGLGEDELDRLEAEGVLSSRVPVRPHA